MSLIFKKIEIRNFLSFGNNTQELNLEFDGTTLVMGENLDAGGANGVGKTTIINAISYALFNKPVSNISKERLINKTNNTKNTQMEIRLSFSKDDIDYEVYRGRGETYTIQLFEDGEDVTPDSVAAVDKKILEVIGFSYDLFCRVVVFSGNDVPFLDMPISIQRTLIEELFNITILSEKAIKLREFIKQTEMDVQTQTALIHAQEKAKDAHEKRIVDAKNRMDKWDGERLENLEVAKNELSALDNIDFDIEEALHVSINEMYQVITKLKTQKATTTKDIERKEKRLKEIENDITHLMDAKCPYCLQKYDSSDKKIEELAEEIEGVQATHEELTMRLNSLNIELNDIEEQWVLAKESITYSSLQETAKAKASSLIIKTKIQELESGINPHIDAYDAAVNEAIEVVDIDNLDDLKKTLEHQQFLLKLLTDKNSFVRRKIINKTIPFLNGRINSYTSDLGLPHIVKFDADMSCTVSEFGRELDFGNLSGGEKKRVNLALSLAFRDVFHHLHSKINALFMDEVDHSLDGAGIDSIIKVIKNKSRNENIGIWVIMHRLEALGRFDSELKIVKHNGFSHFEHVE